jgi:hypothetical protein
MNRNRVAGIAFAAVVLTIGPSRTLLAVQDSLQVTTTNRGRVTAATSIAMASLEIAPAEVEGGAGATATIRFDGHVLRNSVDVIELSSSDPAVVSVPATVPLSGSIVTFPIQTTRVAETRMVDITARKHGEQTARLIVRMPLRFVSLTLEPKTVTVRGSSKGTIELNGPTLAETRVRLTSSHPTIVQVPEEVTLAAREAAAVFVATVARRPLAPTPVMIRAELGDPARPQTIETAIMVRP